MEAKASKLREEKHEECEAAGWPRRDTKEAGGKAINEGFNKANDSFYEAQAARMAKEKEVTKLQGATGYAPEAQKTGKGKAANHPAEEAVCQARSSPRRLEEGFQEPKKQRTGKSTVPSDKRNARKEDWMEAVRKESVARYKAEELYAAWAKAEKTRV